jgi:hypothetical protein
LAGKGTKEIDEYANGRVNALPLSYAAHCHPYARRKKRWDWEGTEDEEEDGRKGPRKKRKDEQEEADWWDNIDHKRLQQQFTISPIPNNALSINSLGRAHSMRPFRFVFSKSMHLDTLFV